MKSYKNHLFSYCASTLGLTTLEGRIPRLTTAGRDLYWPSLLSASCYGSTPLLSFYTVFPISLFLPCSTYCITLFQCLGPRPQKQQVAFRYCAAQAALIVFSTAGNWDWAFVCARCYSKPPHWSTDPNSTVLYFKTLACTSDHNVTFGLGCPYEVNKKQTQEIQDDITSAERPIANKWLVQWQIWYVGGVFGNHRYMFTISFIVFISFVSKS